MPDIDNLQEKVDALLPFARPLLVSGNERLSRRSLMRFLGPHLNDRDFSQMMRGRLEKGIPPGRVPHSDLDRLAVLLAQVIGGQCTTSDAKKLWHGELATFLAAIGAGERVDLLDTLARFQPELAISLQKKKRSTLRAVSVAQTIQANDFEVMSNECVQFKIEASPGRLLLVLCHEPFRVWRLIAPGRLHDGVIHEKSTTLPNLSPPWFPFDAPFGLHEFIFIEHDAKLRGLLPPNVRDDRILDAGEIANLARKLANPANARLWRWAMRVVNAVPA